MKASDSRGCGTKCMTEVQGGRSDKKVTFLLVHGTFARGANWTAPESPLCGALVSAANDLDLAADIERIPWSGRNRVRDRIEAARKIDCALRRIDRDVSPHVVLVGHSHGGSAIAHFLRRRENVPRVSGCAFLSTPFVATRVSSGRPSRSIRPCWPRLPASPSLCCRSHSASRSGSPLAFSTRRSAGRRWSRRLSLSTSTASHTASSMSN